MAVKGGIRVPVVTTVDTKDLAKMTGDLEKMKSKVGGVNKAFRMAGVAAAGAAVVSIGRNALQEASDAYKINQLTNTILKNTGASAYITSQQISDLSGKLAVQAGIDDDLVQAGANVILSFKNIRNVGSGAAAIFDRATAAAVDLSTKFKGNVSLAAKALGRALNDPVKGLTALTKAGVVFTNGQKEQIKAMQARGDLIGAQQVILQSVEGTFKGAAAAMATPMDKLNAAMQQIMEKLGTPLLQSLIPMIDKLSPNFEKAANGAFKFGQMIVNVFKNAWKFRGLIINVAKLLVAMWAYTKVSAAAQAIVGIIMTVVKAMKALRTASIAATVAEAVATGGTSLIAVGAGIAAATAAVIGMNTAIDNLSSGLEDMPDIKMPEMVDMKSNIDDLANSYSGLGAATDAAAQSGRDFAAGAKKVTSATRAANKPKTSRVKALMPMTGNQSFTVAGSGGGISLSVTVNGSVVQERDLARTIRNELLVLSRRQGSMPAFGV